MSLQHRTTAFLEKPIPDEVDYVEGSLAERILIRYAADGRLDRDSEELELLELCIEESREASQGGSAACRAWFQESLELLEAIRAEAD